MICSIKDLAQTSESDLSFLPIGARNRIMEALRLDVQDTVAPADPSPISTSFLVPGAEVTLSELQENLVAHHTVNWPQHDFRVLRSRRGISIDYGCATEQLNTSLKKLNCSFFVKIRCSNSHVVIADLCAEHSCVSALTELHRN